MDGLFKIAVLPVVFLLYFAHKKDPHPEQMRFLMKIFGLGCLSAIPVLFCELFYEGVLKIPEDYGSFALFWNTFWGVAFVEEIFKWIAMFVISYRSKKFDETYDGIVYGAFSSMGFACIENLLYVVLGFSVVTGVLRALTAVPGHFCYGVIMGYFMSKARYNKENGKSGIIYIFLSILIPTALHALYDYLILDGTGLDILVWFVLIIVMFVSCFILIIRAAKNNAPIGAPEEPVVATPAQTATTPATPASPAAQTIQPAVPTEPVAPVVTRVAPAPAPTPTLAPAQEPTPTPELVPTQATAPTINTAPTPTVAVEPTPTPQTTNTTNTTQADSITTISWETRQNGQNNS